MRWLGDVACTREKRNAYRVLLWKHEGKKPLENLDIYFLFLYSAHL
jgi:hypothetical protein